MALGVWVEIKIIMKHSRERLADFCCFVVHALLRPLSTMYTFEFPLLRDCSSFVDKM